MGINKIVYNGGTLIDLTGDTVTADKLMQGYTAHDKSGEVIIGTATGGGGAVIQDEDGGLHFLEDGVNAFSDAVTELANGGFLHTITGVMANGGGLEYEEGTFAPETDVSMPTINFTNTHNTIPFCVVMTDATGTDDTTQNTNYGFAFCSLSEIGGTKSPNGNSGRYDIGVYEYRDTGNPSQVAFGVITDTGSASASYRGFWVTTTRFKPNSNSTTRYWRAGRTYKWIAVWAPTT